MEKPDENLGKRMMADEGGVLASEFQLGKWRVDTAAGELLDGERCQRLEPKLMRILQVLASAPGSVIGRDQLFDATWPRQVVADQTLDSAISRLRSRLDDNPKAPAYIQTVPKVGYRLLAEVAPIQPRPNKGNQTQVVQAPSEPEQTGAEHRAGNLAVARRLGAALLMLLGVLVWAWVQRPLPVPALVPPIEPRPVAPSLALLSFGAEQGSATNESARSPANQGLAIELGDQLARLPGLRVASRHSSDRFSSARIENVNEVQRIAQRLGVDYVLGGQWSASGRRLQLRLVEAEQGRIVWEQVHDRSTTSGLAIRDAVITQVAGSLLPKNSGLLAQSRLDRPMASTTYDLYLLGRHYWQQRQADSLLEAERLFREAVIAEPDFALAHIGLSSTYLSMMRYSGMPADESLDLARAPMARAMELAPNLAETQQLLGQWHWLKAEWVPAESSLKRALTLNPNLIMAQMYLGNVYNDSGRLDQAYASYQQASILDPLHTTVLMNLTQVSLKLGLYERAHHYLERAKDLFPSHDFLFGLSVHLAISANDRDQVTTLVSDWQIDQAADPASPDPVDVLSCIMGAAFLDLIETATGCVHLLPEALAGKGMRTLYAVMASSYTVWVETQANGEVSAATLDLLSDYVATLDTPQLQDPVLLYEIAVAKALLGQFDESVSTFLRSSELGGRDLGWMNNDPRLDRIRDREEVASRLSELSERQAILMQKTSHGLGR